MVGGEKEIDKLVGEEREREIIYIEREEKVSHRGYKR